MALPSGQCHIKGRLLVVARICKNCSYYIGAWDLCVSPPVRFLLTGSDGPLATSKTAPAEKSGLPVGPENGELSKEELIRRKREEFIQKHGKGLDKSR